MVKSVLEYCMNSQFTVNLMKAKSHINLKETKQKMRVIVRNTVDAEKHTNITHIDK